MLIVLGDCNAKVGEEQIYETVAGKHSLHAHTNNSGERLCHLAGANHLIIASTFFDHKRIHKATRTSPDGRITNQIDHILVNNYRRNNILDIRTYRGENCDSDCMLVGVRIKQKISRYFGHQNKMYMEKWDVDKLCDKDIKLQYKQDLENRLNNTKEIGDVDEKWGNVKNSISKVAKTFTGTRNNKKNEEWFDQDSVLAIQQKNNARMKYLLRKTRSTKEEYEEKRKRATKICRQKKR